MKPVICFYRNEQYILSRRYRLETPQRGEGVLDFLKRIDEMFHEQMKIVQISFEALHADLFAKQKSLYPCAAAHIFILDEVQFISAADLLQKKSTLPDNEISVWSFFETEEDFKNKVNSVKNEIGHGRYYQINLTSALSRRTSNTAQELLQIYARHFLGEYKALLPLPEIDVISFSPELFLEKINHTLRTRPIKGSMADEQSLTENLIKSQKEEAELSMIVDLLRNDLNRCESKSSARVTEHRALLNLDYIQHTFSEVCIETNRTLADVLESCFPGGSISGCPKLESLKALSELENIKRQVYTGSIGWWQKDEFSLNLAIRTFIKHRDELFYHAGCGIVYDSEPENEWQEFLLKTGRINHEPNEYRNT